MAFVPLSDLTTSGLFKNIRLIATDMDGTLTQNGKFTPALLQAFEDLNSANIKVLIVTGRSAGWVSGLANYLPIVGAIAENGGLFYPSNNEAPITLASISNRADHRQQLTGVFQKLQLEFPQICESSDNVFRITDWTFDVRGLSLIQIQEMSKRCHELGWGFTYSNVQCHIKPLDQDKATGLLQVLQKYFPQYKSKVVTVGDSPNDEALFNPSYFPISVGVANVLEYANQLKYQPAYITAAGEGQGFCELTRQIVNW
jgi:hypothetical protein